MERMDGTRNWVSCKTTQSEEQFLDILGSDFSCPSFAAVASNLVLPILVKGHNKGKEKNTWVIGRLHKTSLTTA
jgi:hypothetical protein